jgi:hypothetical protein
MRQTRPTIVLVIAILHFVGGGLGATGAVCGLAAQGITGGKMFTGFGGQQGGQQATQVEVQKKLEQAMDEKMPGYKQVELWGMVSSLILSTLMIVSGIGLLQMRPWGRIVSIVYAVFSILNHIFTLIYTFAFTIPAMNAIFQDMAAKDPQAKAVTSIMEFAVIAGTIVAALFALYPVFVLIVMLTPSVANAFRQKLDLTQSPEDIEEEPDLPWGRRHRAEPDDRIQPDER